MKGVLLPVLSIIVALTACDVGGKEARSTQAPTTSTETAPTVESSLDGLTVLPSRIRWSATTSLRPEQVREVLFNVDGERWWVDRSPPYAYGPEGAYLPTRWLSARRIGSGGGLLTQQSGHRHAFMVKVIGKNGQEWSVITRARSPDANVARHAPGSFRGYLGDYGWGHLSAADLADPPSDSGAALASYTGRLVFIGAALFSGVETGEFAWEISSDSRHVYLRTPIYLDTPGGPASWWGYRKLTKVLCAPDGPPATYVWSVTRGRHLYAGHYTRYLHLRALDEPCSKRRRMLQGVWDEIQD